MAGVAGRSGRKSWDKEKDSKALWNLSVPVLRGYLTSRAVPVRDRAQVALELVKKMAPQAQQGTSPLPTGPAPKFIFYLGNGQQKEMSTSEMLASASRTHEGSVKPTVGSTNGGETGEDA